MFLLQLKTAITVALREVFGPQYPVADFRQLPITIEFPFQEQQYPGVWVTWDPVGTISKGGLDNEVYGPPELTTDDNPNVFFRYRFSGYAMYTVGALTSMQRDRLYDELVRVFLMSGDPNVISYRTYVEENPYIMMNMDFDTISTRGMAENAGTPWGTNDFIYEATLAIETVGEFVSDEYFTSLVPLAQINTTGQGLAFQSATVPMGPQIGVDFPVNLQVTPHRGQPKG
jgi:hypothetical protein